MPRQTNFKRSDGNDIGDVLTDRDYLYSVYPELDTRGLTLFSYGFNNSAQIGDNTAASRSTPRQEFTSSTNWMQIAGGNSISSAIKTDGTLWLWGSNNSGGLARNDLNTRSTPVQEFTSSTNWRQVALGSQHTAAIKTDGTLWAWGYGVNGQLGDNTTADRSTPRQEITVSNNWKQVSCGDSHTVAIKTNGTLWGWGNNGNGQLGDNSTANRLTPRQEITSSTNWRQVSCGYRHTAAIKTDGTLWVWGRNSYGQIGDNTNGNAGNAASRSTPRQEFTSSTNWKQVSGNVTGEHTAAIKTDGTLWVWGKNDYGQIGDNATGSHRSTPRQEFTSSTNWKEITGGTSITIASKTNGTLWGWGRSDLGQVGDNTSSFSKATPVQEFTSSTNWVSIESGAQHTLALKAPQFVE